jgi:hypothetical protein
MEALIAKNEAQMGRNEGAAPLDELGHIPEVSFEIEGTTGPVEQTF